MTSITSMPYTSRRSIRKLRSPWGSRPMPRAWSAVNVLSWLADTSISVWNMRLFCSMKNLQGKVSKSHHTGPPKRHCVCQTGSRAPELHLTLFRMAFKPLQLETPTLLGSAVLLPHSLYRWPRINRDKAVTWNWQQCSHLWVDFPQKKPPYQLKCPL